MSNTLFIGKRHIVKVSDQSGYASTYVATNMNLGNVIDIDKIGNNKDFTNRTLQKEKQSRYCLLDEIESKMMVKLLKKTIIRILSLNIVLKSIFTIIMILMPYNLSAQSHTIKRENEVSAQISVGQLKRKTSNNSTNYNSIVQKGKSSKKSKKRKIINKEQHDGSHKSGKINISEDELEKKYELMSMISLERYANQGDAMAQFYLGYKYAQNEDYKTAVEWYRKAAFNDLIRAQLWLAWCYYHGKGVDKDIIGAKEWLKEAASKGSAEAKEYLRTWTFIKDY